MGIKVEIGGERFYIQDYTVTEDSTPIAGDDTTGGVGTLELVLPLHPSPFTLIDQEVRLTDTKRGYTLGRVREINESDDGANMTVTCQSRLTYLNIYDVQAQPFSGTLREAFEYYCSLAGVELGVITDDRVALREVSFPGWYGELWFNLKLMAASQDCEIALVSGIMVLRPLRTNEAIEYQDLARGRTYGGVTISRNIEIYQYNNRYVSGGLIYPGRAWNAEESPLSVEAGGYAEFDIELSASVNYVQQPQATNKADINVAYSDTSVYCLTGNDDESITAEKWNAYGGWVKVEIGEDTKTLKIRIQAPKGLKDSKGEDHTTINLAITAMKDGPLIPFLRVVGSGVFFEKTLNTFPTCAPEDLITTDVGITIDSPFIGSSEEAFRTGIRAARMYSGEGLTLSGTVSALNQRGVTGEILYASYGDEQDYVDGKTYEQVEDQVATEAPPGTYGSWEEFIGQKFGRADNLENQLFGNLGGTRVWDRKTGRYFRVRTSTVSGSSGTISFDADDDTTYRDIVNIHRGKTYQQVQDEIGEVTYQYIERTTPK